MISKIIHNKYSKKVVLKEVKVSKNKEFLIWEFEGEENKKYIGFTPVVVYYGAKTHLWYSLLMGYFLPHSYTIKFENVIGKECYITTDGKGVVRGLIPIANKVIKELDVTKEETEATGENPNEDLFE